MGEGKRIQSGNLEGHFDIIVAVATCGKPGVSFVLMQLFPSYRIGLRTTPFNLHSEETQKQTSKMLLPFIK